jgi:hypothetical protein
LQVRLAAVFLTVLAAAGIVPTFLFEQKRN